MQTLEQAALAALISHIITAHAAAIMIPAMKVAVKVFLVVYELFGPEARVHSHPLM
jgi:hypothetical protein